MLPNDLGKKMIQHILDFLFSQPEFSNKNENCMMNILAREPALIHIFFTDGTNYFIKVATEHIVNSAQKQEETTPNKFTEDKSLFSSVRRIGREYDALVKYSEIYPSLLPEIIFFRKFDRHAILVTKGIKHSAVNLNDILRAKLSIRRQIQHLLIGRDRIISTDKNELNNLALVLDHALNSLPAYLLQNFQKIRLAHDWDEMLVTLPLIPQHGDLAVNNFGLTSTGLVLFDWEDYAFINTPGFDLSILLVSGCRFDISKLVSLIENDFNQSHNNSFLQPIIEGIGIKPSQFYDLMLINLIIFYQLKCQHGYGKDIIDSTENALKVLSASIAESRSVI